MNRPRIAPLGDERLNALAPQFTPQQFTTVKDRRFHRTLAHHPSLLRGYLEFVDGIRPGVMPLRDRELITLFVAAECRCDYVLVQHAAIASAAGLPEADIALAAGGARNLGSEAFDPFERALLSGAHQLLSVHRLSAPTWSRLSARYEPDQLLELVFMVGRVAMACGFLNSCEVENEAVP